MWHFQLDNPDEQAAAIRREVATREDACKDIHKVNHTSIYLLISCFLMCLLHFEAPRHFSYCFHQLQLLLFDDLVDTCEKVLTMIDASIISDFCR